MDGQDAPDAAVPGSGSWTPAPFVELPAEILYKICHELLEHGGPHPVTHHDWSSLKSLARTCRRLHGLVQPLFYTSITTVGGLGSPTGLVGMKVNLGILMRTLWENPRIGQMIRHLVLCYEPSFRTYKLRYRRRFPIHCVSGNAEMNREVLIRLWMMFVRTKKRPQDDLHSESMIQWCQKSIVPTFLLVCLAPKLSSLQIHIPLAWTSCGTAEDWVQRGRTFPPTLTRLGLATVFHLFSGDEYFSPGRSRVFIEIPKGTEEFELFKDLDGFRSLDRPFLVQAVEMLLASAPNIRVLELSNFSSWGADLCWPTLGHSPALLESLVLKHTYIPMDQLNLIARACPRLRRVCILHYDLCVVELDGYRDPLFHPPAVDVVEALRPLEQTLEILDLDCAVFNYSPRIAIRKLGPNFVRSFPYRQDRKVHNLGGFKRLKVLGISADYLDTVSQDALLQLLQGCGDLRGLLLRSANVLSKDSLLCFAQAISERAFRRLREVRLVSMAHHPRDRPCQMESLQEWEQLQAIATGIIPELFRSAGVQLRLEMGDEERYDRTGSFLELEGNVGAKEAEWHNWPRTP